MKNDLCNMYVRLTACNLFRVNVKTQHFGKLSYGHAMSKYIR